MPTMVYKKETISGSPAVTDNVTAGDLRPVTSNAVSGALANVEKIVVVTNGNADNLIPAQEDKVVWYRGSMSNTPFDSSSQIMLNSKTYTSGNNKNVYQEVERYDTTDDKYIPAKYIRYGYRNISSEGNYTWSPWEKQVGVVNYNNVTIDLNGLTSVGIYSNFHTAFTHAPTLQNIQTNAYASCFSQGSAGRLVQTYTVVGFNSSNSTWYTEVWERRRIDVTWFGWHLVRAYS